MKKIGGCTQDFAQERQKRSNFSLGLTGKSFFSKLLDHAVIQDGKAKTFETTSHSANKTAQLKKEQEILDNGGAFVRDRDTRSLVPVEGLSKLRRED